MTLQDALALVLQLVGVLFTKSFGFVPKSVYAIGLVAEIISVFNLQQKFRERKI